MRFQGGIRLGCILPPVVFNLYYDKNFKEALEDSVKGVFLNIIRYTDHTLLTSYGTDGL